VGYRFIGVYDSGAVVTKGDDLKQAYTAGFTQIKSLAEGREAVQAERKVPALKYSVSLLKILFVKISKYENPLIFMI